MVGGGGGSHNITAEGPEGWSRLPLNVRVADRPASTTDRSVYGDADFEVCLGGATHPEGDGTWIDAVHFAAKTIGARVPEPVLSLGRALQKVHDTRESRWGKRE